MSVEFPETPRPESECQTGKKAQVEQLFLLTGTKSRRCLVLLVGGNSLPALLGESYCIWSKQGGKLTWRRVLYFQTDFTCLFSSPVLSSISSNSTLNVNFYLTVYGCIAGANSVFTILRAFLFACGTIHAATVIHNRLLRRVMKVNDLGALFGKTWNKGGR